MNSRVCLYIKVKVLLWFWLVCVLVSILLNIPLYNDGNFFDCRRDRHPTNWVPSLFLASTQ